MFTSSQVFGREVLLSRVIDVVESGLSAWIIGNRLSGRSAVLKELKKRLEDNDWTCVELSGHAGLSVAPLSALNIAGDETGEDIRARFGIPEMLADLRTRIRPARTIVLVDDADQLDDISVGLIGALAREYGASIIATSLVGLHHEQSSPFSAGVHGLTFPLGPVGFEDLEEILRDRLGAPVEIATMSRVYAKSSGIVGVACAIVEAAIIENRMLQEPGSKVWKASENLWSSSLDSVVGVYIQHLTAEENEALEAVSIAGIVDLTTVRKVVPAAPLEVLEARGLLRTAMSGDRQIVSVVPALITEAIRSRPTPIYRARLAEELADHISQNDAGARHATELLRQTRSSTDVFDPIYVRLHNEHVQAELLSASVKWDSNPNAVTARAYVRALANSNAEFERVREVFDSTSTSSDGPADQAEYAILRAEWIAIVEDDLDSALFVLREARAVVGESFAKLLDAATVRLECLLRGVPQDYVNRLVASEQDSPLVRIRIEETAMLAHLAMGRLSQARASFERIPTDHSNAYNTPANELYGWLLMAEGRYAEAVAWSDSGLEKASGDLDAESMLAHAYLGAMLAVFAGYYDVADDKLSRILATGDVSPLLAHSRLGLWVIGTILVIRRGNMAVADRFLRGLKRHRVRFGPLFGQAPIVATAQLDAYNGDVDTAVQQIWAEGERAWSRGHRLVATQLMMMSAEMQMTPERLDAIRDRVRQVEGAFTETFFRFLEARESHNAKDLVALVPALTDSGRPGLAALALDVASRIADDQHLDYTGEIGSTRQNLREQTGGRQLDTKRFLVSVVSLTDREREIVDLVSRGMSNPEIASRLVLSVRTVESHLSRILKKAEVRNREELVVYYQSYWR